MPQVWLRASRQGAGDPVGRCLVEPTGSEHRLNTPMQVTKPSWMATTSTSPAAPGRMKANPNNQHAGSAQAVSMTMCCPDRAG